MNNKKFLFLGGLSGLLIGTIIPLVFIKLDLNELEMKFSLSNIIWNVSSQRILLVATILFPILFFILGALLFFLRSKNLELAQMHIKSKESFLYVESIFQSITDMIMVVNVNGSIIKLNSSAAENIKQTPSSFHELFILDENISWQQFRERYLSSRLFNLELVLKHENIPVLLSAVLLNENESNTDQIICTLKNIKKIKELQDEIVMQINTNSHNSRMVSLGVMAADIAHEINNPLTIIKLSNEIIIRLLSKELEDDFKEVILDECANIKATVERTGKIVSSMRKLSRDPTLEDFENHSLMEVIEDTLPLINEKNKFMMIQLIFVNDNKLLDLKIPLKRIQISQVLINMIGNSVDAIIDLSERWIKFEAEIFESFLRFSITDSGKGIDLELSKKIFLPFYTSKTSAKGTGLGLSISANIIKIHGGKIEIDHNCPNTKFSILFPLKVV